MRTALYRLYDVNNGLLYVGISANPDVRWGQHSQTKPWWSEVADRKVEWHQMRADAAEAERVAIKAERPVWNLQHAVGEVVDSEAGRLFAEYRNHVEELRILDGPMKEMAVRELKAGASVRQLAEMTGLTDEVFRRIARQEGVERRRPPTVGREVEGRRDDS